MGESVEERGVGRERLGHVGMPLSGTVKTENCEEKIPSP